MRTICFRFTGAGNQAFQIEKSTRLKGVACTNMTRAALTQDPAFLTTDLSGPPVNDQRSDVIAFMATTPNTGLDILIRSQLTYYVAASGVGSVLLYLDP